MIYLHAHLVILLANPVHQTLMVGQIRLPQPATEGCGVSHVPCVPLQTLSNHTGVLVACSDAKLPTAILLGAGQPIEYAIFLLMQNHMKRAMLAAQVLSCEFVRAPAFPPKQSNSAKCNFG